MEREGGRLQMPKYTYLVKGNAVVQICKASTNYTLNTVNCVIAKVKQFSTKN